MTKEDGGPVVGVLADAAALALKLPGALQSSESEHAGDGAVAYVTRARCGRLCDDAARRRPV